MIWLLSFIRKIEGRSVQRIYMDCCMRSGINSKYLFLYQKFWDTELSTRTVDPYALKEFRNRWYLLAKDIKDENVKSFALDRLTLLEISNKAFDYSKTFNIIDENYRYCFGIISPNGENPEENNFIILTRSKGNTSKICHFMKHRKY